MRAKYPTCGLTLLLAASFASGQTTTTLTIAVENVEARSGPGTNYYPTRKLYRGDRVDVVREEQGWLAIAPPGGSFSWIAARNIDRIGRWGGAVNTNNSPLRVGSMLHNQPPSVERTRVARGTQVTILGKEEPIDGQPWLPILPAPGEVRYVPANSVQGSIPQATTVSPPSYTGGPGQTTARSDGFAAQQAANWALQPQPQGGTIGQPLTSGSSHPLWQEAERAEKSGNHVGAIELYERLASQVKDSDYGLYLTCINRGQYLRDRVRAASMVTQQSNRPFASGASVTPAIVSGQQPPVAQGSWPGGAGAGQPKPLPLSTQQVMPNNSPPSGSERAAPPAASPDGFNFPSVNPPASVPALPVAKWSEMGTLYRPALPAMAGKRVYGLQKNGNILAYAIENQGVTLEPYVNKTVSLYGLSTYNGEMKRDVIAVQQVSESSQAGAIR